MTIFLIIFGTLIIVVGLITSIIAARFNGFDNIETNMEYKVGDKVKVKSLDWYNANKNSEGVVNFHNLLFFDELMSEFCGKVVTIDAYIPRGNYYDIKEDGKVNLWSDDMFEGLAIEEPQDKMISLDKACEYLESALKHDLGYYRAADFADTFRKAMEE